MYAFRISCWALIFIFRLRFPPGISIATIEKFAGLARKMDFYLTTSASTSYELRKASEDIFTLIIKTIESHLYSHFREHFY